MNKKRKCLVCGKEYDYCSSCGGSRNKPSWMVNYCSENCRTIYYVCADYSCGAISKEEAQAKLKNTDLSNRKSFSDSTSGLLHMILSALPKKAKKGPESTPTDKAGE